MPVYSDAIADKGWQLVTRLAKSNKQLEERVASLYAQNMQLMNDLSSAQAQIYMLSDESEQNDLRFKYDTGPRFKLRWFLVIAALTMTSAVAFTALWR